MVLHSWRLQSPLPGIFIFALTIVALGCGPLSYADSQANKNLQIEYIAPDGQLSSLKAEQPAAHETTASFVDRNTVSCVLRQGETTFIIELPINAPRDRFTFLNENAEACGELRIAVSDSPLPADSPKWTEVDGIVPFAHKRLFKLSILGVETKFVRLSFRVDGERQNSARVLNPFRNSALTAAINSNFARLYADEGGLSLAAADVAALPPQSR